MADIGYHNRLIMRSATFGFLLLKYCLSIVLFLLSGIYTDIHAQGGYYVIGEVSTNGINVIDAGDRWNSEYCRVKIGKDIKTFTPYEVDEYGFADGRVYIAKTIIIDGSETRVFLQRLSRGSHKMYYYNGHKGKFFLLETAGGELREFPLIDEGGISFRTKLKDYTADFPEGFDAVESVAFSRDALLLLFSRYEKREHRPFPHLRYGATLGYGLTDLIPQSRNLVMGNTSFRMDGSFSAGFFADKPILLSDLSINLAINISRQVYNYYWSSESGDNDLFAKTTSLEIPLLLRYSWPSVRIRPFFNAGGLVVMNLSNQSILYRTTFFQNTINLEIDKSLYISDSYKGLTAGAGIEYRLRNKDYVSTEVRYSMLWSNEKTQLINMNVLNITMGYFF